MRDYKRRPALDLYQKPVDAGRAEALAKSLGFITPPEVEKKWWLIFEDWQNRKAEPEESAD